MSEKSRIDHIDAKKIKFEDYHEKLSSFSATYKNSVVDCFKIKCLKFFKDQLDDKKIQADNTFNNTGNIV